MDKKTVSTGLIALSVISVILAGLDYFSDNFAPLGLGADSWIGVAALLAVYAIYVKTA